MLLFRSVAFDIPSVVSFIQSVVHVTFSISCVFYSISCICDLFDQFDIRSVVLFSQSFVLRSVVFDVPSVVCFISVLHVTYLT